MIYICMYTQPLLLSIIRMIGLALAIGQTTMLRCLPGIVVSHFSHLCMAAGRAGGRAGGLSGGRAGGLTGLMIAS